MFGPAEVSRLQHCPKSSHWREGNPFALSALAFERRDVIGLLVYDLPAI